MGCLARFLAFAAICVPLLPASEVRADSFRCGSAIAREGLTAQEIEERCGKADLVRVKEEPVYTRLENGASVQVGTLTTQVWYYDRGPNQYVAKITIRDALAEKIELLEVTDIESIEDP